MQIVPRTAGADCAQSLKKPFSAPTGNYLYEPENNIEMGVHYLYLLKKDISPASTAWRSRTCASSHRTTQEQATWLRH
jgi:hypothetical protein